MTIRELRMKHNLTQTELGEKTGVSQQTIARYETGRAQIPQAFVAKIVHHFNITLEEGWQMMEQVPKKDRRTRRGPYIGRQSLTCCKAGASNWMRSLRKRG